ncbi:MAG: DUF4232 domain-containing protein [Chroococcidiopsidaceae cyanobacterium CP_BM_ER_R8_30]|nr:DUF4232 domain-containing protein [Chroococcidiopsidaceae cyanobacterium CP_BM_ER_R8_30]
MVCTKYPQWWIAIVAGLTVGTCANCGGAGASDEAIAVASPSRCHTSQLSVSFKPGSPGAGQRYATLVLTNHSSKTCRIYGYVGMQLLDAQHLPLPTNVVRNTTQPPRRFLLSPGKSAFSTLHWTVVNGPGEPSNRQCEPTPSYVEVTPPNEMDFLLTRWNFGFVCLHGRIGTSPLVP